MIITRTPMRISFVGGGTDLPSFYRNFGGGAVVSMSINKYFYLSLHAHFDENSFLLKYSKTESVSDIRDISHPIIRQVFQDNDLRNADFASAADIPSGTGLGGSSAFTVGLVQLVNSYRGRYVPQHRLAELACEIEIDKLKEPIGKQDQFGAAIGGLKYISFNVDDSVSVEPITLSHDHQVKLEQNLLLFYLGVTRSASKVLKEQDDATKKNKEVADSLAKMAEQARQLKTQLPMNVDALGEYLHEGWMRKRTLTSAISNPVVDDAYETARAAGAVGGKLLGAGGGGFLLCYVPEERQERVIESLSKLKLLRVKTDYAGTCVVFDDRTDIS